MTAAPLWLQPTGCIQSAAECRRSSCERRDAVVWIGYLDIDRQGGVLTLELDRRTEGRLVASAQPLCPFDRMKPHLGLANPNLARSVVKGRNVFAPEGDHVPVDVLLIGSGIFVTRIDGGSDEAGCQAVA